MDEDEFVLFLRAEVLDIAKLRLKERDGSYQDHRLLNLSTLPSLPFLLACFILILLFYHHFD